MPEDLRTLVRHSPTYGAGTILRTAVGLLLLPIYARYNLTPSEHGVLPLLSRTRYRHKDRSRGITSMLIRYREEW